MTVLDAESPSRRLKAATADLHRRVEDGLDLFRRAESLEGYATILARFEAFHRAVEPLLPLSEGRAARLRDDLDALAPGWRPEEAVEPPAYPTPAHALGGLYVVEGAALGGQIVARFLHARHGLTPARGASFFASGGHPVGPRWKAVRALLDAEPDVEAMVEGATATFLAFERSVVREAALA